MVGQDTELSGITQTQDRSDIGGLARRGFLSLAGSGVSALASLLVIMVVTRGADKQQAGDLFSATSLFVIAESLCALGTATGLVYFIARVRALGKGYGTRGLIRTALPPVLVVSVLSAGGLMLLAPTIAQIIAKGPDPTLATSIRILGAFLPFAVVFDVLIAATRGFHTMAPTALLEQIGRPTLQISLLLVALELGGGWMLPLAWVAPYAVGFGFAVMTLNRLVQREAPSTNDEQPIVTAERFWKYTGPRGIAAVAQLTLQRLDIVLVAALLGPREAAVYTAATRFVVLGQLGSQAVSLAVQPKFSELLANHDLAATQRVYRTSTAWVIAVTWPIHLLVGALAPIILLLFGKGYDEGTWVVVILAGSMLVATGCGMVTMLLVMAGRTTANLINVVVALGANLALNVVLIPRWGIVGAAVAWAIAIVLSNLLPLFQIRVSLGLQPFGRSGAAVMLLAAITLAGVPSVGLLLGGGTPIMLGFAAIGVVFYAAGIWTMRSRLELDALTEPMMRRLR